MHVQGGKLAWCVWQVRSSWEAHWREAESTEKVIVSVVFLEIPFPARLHVPSISLPWHVIRLGKSQGRPSRLPHRPAFEGRDKTQHSNLGSFVGIMYIFFDDDN